MPQCLSLPVGGQPSAAAAASSAVSSSRCDSGKLRTWELGHQVLSAVGTFSGALQFLPRDISIGVPTRLLLGHFATILG